MLLKVSYFFLLCSALSWALDIEVLGTNKDAIDFALAETIFENYIQKFNKNYKSDEERQKKLEVIVDNAIYINKRNLEIGYKGFELTIFSDLTAEEFRNTHSNCVSMPDVYDDLNVVNSSYVAEYYGLGKGAPASWDWAQQGAVTGARDQNPCGFCWAFSSVGCIEGQNFIKHNQLVELSEQELGDCIKSVQCRSGGYSPLQAFQDLSGMAGCMSEADYPYEGGDGQCRLDASKVKVKVLGGKQPSANEETLMELLHTYGPISIIISYEAGLSHYAPGTIYDPGSACETNSYHAILLVGYGTNENGVPYWKIKNSWGPQWGNNGFGLFARNKRTCHIAERLATVDIA